MVTIKRIEIEDFLGQGNLVWNLDPEINILGGKNGSGKSTILKVCYDLLASGDDLKTFPENDRYKGLFSSFTITFSNDWSISWKLECSKNIVLDFKIEKYDDKTARGTK